MFKISLHEYILINTEFHVQKFFSTGFFSVSYFPFHQAAETMSLITAVLAPCSKIQT